MRRVDRWLRAPLALALASVLAACGDGLEGPEGLGLTPGEERTVQGAVVENSIDPCAFPDEHDEPCEIGGPEYLSLDVDGSKLRVYWHRGEGVPCDDVEAIGQGDGSRVGTRVEVFAVVDEDWGGDPVLDTCPSRDYYIEALE